MISRWSGVRTRCAGTWTGSRTPARATGAPAAGATRRRSTRSSISSSTWPSAATCPAIPTRRPRSRRNWSWTTCGSTRGPSSRSARSCSTAWTTPTPPARTAGSPSTANGGGGIGGFTTDLPPGGCNASLSRRLRLGRHARLLRRLRQDEPPGPHRHDPLQLLDQPGRRTGLRHRDQPAGRRQRGRRRPGNAGRGRTTSTSSTAT